MDVGLSYLPVTKANPIHREPRQPGRRRGLGPLAVVLAAIALGANAQPLVRNAPEAPSSDAADYLIGYGDTLQIFVWKNPELSTEVPVRPDGRITTPLVEDIQAQGRRPTELAADLKRALSAYIQDPVVTVLVKGFSAPGNSAAVLVIGAAVTPKSVPYRAGLTALDVLIDVGGLTPVANGNGAKLLRREKDGMKSYPLRLKDLVRSGNLKANVEMKPGDIIRIPESMF
jgi:polysaccharide export outer membrane protein